MKFKGLIAATFTPMHAEGKVNVSAIPSIVERLIAHNISGIYICGSTGEGHSLSLADRKRIAESYTEAVNGRIKIIINVGHNSIDDACELTRHARHIQADAISAAPPVYYNIRSEDQLIKTFEKITEAVPELPFYYYHIPALTGFKLDMEEFLKLSAQRLPSLKGIKFTSPAIHEYQSCLNMSNGKYQILYGMDEMLLSGLAAGAECMIGSTYNFMAPLYHKIIEDFNRGDVDSAAQHQLEAVKIIKTFLKYDSLPAQKAIMRMVGVDCGPVGLPLVDLKPKEEKKLKEELEKTELFKWSSVEKASKPSVV